LSKEIKGFLEAEETKGKAINNLTINNFKNLQT